MFEEPNYTSPTSPASSHSSSAGSLIENENGDLSSKGMQTGISNDQVQYDPDSEARRQAKGKFKMVEESNSNYSRQLESGLDTEEEEDDDEESEELQAKRVAENLAAWSVADLKKRQEARGSKIFTITPNLSVLNKRSSKMSINRSSRSGRSNLDSKMGIETGVGIGIKQEEEPIELTPISPTYSNPFESSNHSLIEIDQTPRKRSKITSRFIEHLSDEFPISRNSLDELVRPIDPFLDGFPTSPAMTMNSGKFKSRKRTESYGSSETEMDESSNDGTIILDDPRIQSNFQNQTRTRRRNENSGVGGDDYESRTSSYQSRDYINLNGNDSEFTEEAENGEEKIGILEWLFCGCWGREKEEDQGGRTNPNE